MYNRVCKIPPQFLHGEGTRRHFHTYTYLYANIILYSPTTGHILIKGKKGKKKIRSHQTVLPARVLCPHPQTSGTGQLGQNRETLCLITPELLVVGRRDKHSWFSCCVVLGQGPVTKRLCNSNSIPAAMTTWRPMAITSLGSSLWVSPWGQGDNQGSSFSIGFYWIHFTPRSTSCWVKKAVGITQNFKSNRTPRVLFHKGKWTACHCYWRWTHIL